MRGALASGLGGLGCLAWATQIEPHWLEVVELDMPLTGLPTSWHGKTMVQLSDLHLGPRVSDDWLKSVFARVKEINPDIVVITGDFIDGHDRILEHASALLASLPMGKVATLAVPGNHDYGRAWAEDYLGDGLCEILRGRGVQVLRNRAVDLGGLEIVGFDDFWAKKCLLENGLSGRNPPPSRVALSHNPDTADLKGWGDFRGWILSGHTHGGQCKPPFLPPPLLPVDNRRYVAGAYDVAPGRQLYINRGVGHLTKVRFNVRPELTVFRMAGQ